MPFLRYLTATALLIAAASICAQPLPLAPSPEDVGFSRAALERIDRFVASEIALKRLPGAVIAVARDGKLVVYKAYGTRDPRTNAPMQLDSIFALASMTKPMAVVGALSLTEEGRLPLQAPVSQYFPAFAQMKVGVARADASLSMVDQQRPMTVQDLMRHTSGLTYGGRGDSASPVAQLYPGGSSDAAAQWTTSAFIDNLTRLPLAHQPGTTWEYSYSIDVVGAIVEKVSGQRLGDFLRDKVWTPLGMKDTTFALTDSQRERIAQGFMNDPLTSRPVSIGVFARRMQFDCAGGCAMGTVPDYVRFGQMLLDGGILDGHRILSPKTVIQMTSNHLLPHMDNRVAQVEPHRAGYGFGLGVAVRTMQGGAAVPGSPGEYSWNGANGTQFFVDPKERLVVVVGTAAGGDLRKYYREQVQDLVYGAMIR